MSSSTDVASVLVWPSVPAGERLVSRDATAELDGDWSELMLAEKDVFGSSYFRGLGRGFLACLDGVSRFSSSLFLFRGVSVLSLGSTEGDWVRGDDSWFLNRDSDLGVLLRTCGRMLTSGVSD